MTKSKRRRSIPTKLTENQFNQFILKHLLKRQRGPISKISIFKIQLIASFFMIFSNFIKTIIFQDDKIYNRMIFS